MYTQANWKELIGAMNAGERCQIDAEVYEYFLGVLPPRWMGKVVKVGNEWIYCDFGMGEGCDPTTAFWEKDGQYFCQEIDQFNPADLVVGGKYRYYARSLGRFVNLIYAGSESAYWGTQYKFNPDMDRPTVVYQYTVGCGYTLSAYALNDLEPIKENE